MSGPLSPLGDQDLHLFNEGSHLRLYEKLGAHLAEGGTSFAVWAPNASRVSVIGDFNGWNPSMHPLHPRESSGLWEGFAPDVGAGAFYKYRIVSKTDGRILEKSDPMAFRCETPPKSASIVCDLSYDWGDGAWMAERGKKSALSAPISIYEVHLGSWIRPSPGEIRESPLPSYREVAPKLAEYVISMGFTHVEFMPLMEHPFYGSWGYQVTGYFAPTGRYGTPQDLMFLIDTLHQRGIGVILDWVPSHFPSDGHGLAAFDGTCLYEHADPRKGFHPDWTSHIFNFGRNEVRSFLLSSALFWLDRYHADGLRVDAVASMLYLDYSRKEGEWIPNEHGGRENLEAISFLRRLNEEVYRRFPDVQTIAEESTAWPMVSRPTHVGGLGFGLKWDMGWMNDTLRFMSKETVHRKFHHNDLTFRQLYAHAENFVLPLSHDEVVHGKGSLFSKMPGDDWQKFANLRLLFGYLFGQAGKKLLFMGDEFGQRNEWNHDAALDWHILSLLPHEHLRHWVRDLNRVYRETPALHERDCEAGGFEWIDCDDGDQSVLSFLRRGAGGDEVLVALNFTPVPRRDHRLGVPNGGFWREILNSDAHAYGGSGWGNLGGMRSQPVSHHGRPHSLEINLPPLAAVFFRREGV